LREVKKSVLVGYPAARMYDLVATVEDYPKFLPWCAGSEVTPGEEQTVLATLHIDYHGLKQSFTTRNCNSPSDRITIRLLHGPFRSLEGEWRFTTLAEAACKIDFSLRYEFANGLLERLVGPVFGHIANTLVDAFVQRAEKLNEAD